MEITELISLIEESAAVKSDAVVVRDYEILLKGTLNQPKPIKVLTGLRRSGKSYLLKRLYQHLVAEGVPQGNILFLNFENDRLASHLSTVGLRTIFKTFSLINNSAHPRYVFLDEVQNVHDWHKYIRTIYDSDDFNIFITGSNANLLSGEFASTLGGRVLEFQIQPFNFAELASYKQITFDKANLFSIEKHRPQLARLTQEYFEFGALPESLAVATDNKDSYRRSLLEKIVVNDIVRRHDIGASQVLFNLFLFLERSLGGVVSARNLAQQAGISDGTVARYLELIANTFLISPLQKFHFQARTMLGVQRKYYFVDNIFCGNAALGARLENLVFCELVRRHGRERIFFARNDAGQELDFVVLGKTNQIAAAYQVCYELNDENYSRETAPVSLLRNYNKQELSAEIVYRHDSTKIAKKLSESIVRHVSLEDWLVAR